MAQDSLEIIRDEASPPDPSDRATRRRRFNGTPYLLIAPAALIILAVLAIPLFQLFSLSFQQYKLPELLRGSGDFIGIDNYKSILTDSFFWRVVLRTLVFTAVCVVATVGLGLAIAQLMRYLHPVLRVILNTVLVLVWAIPALVSIAIFQWMVDFEFGVVNYLLTKLGFDYAHHNWFEDPKQGFLVIIALVVWGALPFVIITLYAGLTQVPKELEEAAQVDGANAWQVFRNITIPVLRPILVIVTSLSVIWDFSVFQQIWVMLGSRPSPEYYTISIYAFVTSFSQNDYGQGAAIAVIMVLLLLSVTWIYIRQMLKMGEVS